MGLIQWLFGTEPNYKYIEKQRIKQINENNHKNQYLKGINDTMVRVWNNTLNEGCDFKEAYEWYHKRWEMPAYTDQNGDVMQYFFSNNPDLLPDEYYAMVWGKDNPKARAIAEKLKEKAKLETKNNKLDKMEALEIRLRKVSLEEKVLKSQMSDKEYDEIVKMMNNNIIIFPKDTSEFSFIEKEIVKKEKLVEALRKKYGLMSKNQACPEQTLEQE